MSSAGPLLWKQGRLLTLLLGIIKYGTLQTDGTGIGGVGKRSAFEKKALYHPGK